MTAINVALLADEAHFFSDGGHYDSRTLELRSAGEKVFLLPGHRAAFGFSGPSRGGAALHAAMAGQRGSLVDLLGRFWEIVAGMINREAIRDPYAAILAGVDRGMAMGVAIEETGRMMPLRPGSVIKSIPSAVGFDPANMPESGLAMMMDQRLRHRVVSCFCQHTVVREKSASSKILHRWQDMPLFLSRETIGVKIADLTVDTLNIAPGAVTGVASASGSGSGTTISVSVPNPLNFPIKILCQCPYSYSGTASGSSASIEFIVKRGGMVIFDQKQFIYGGGTKTGFLNPAFIDQITGSQTYSLQCKALGDPNGSGGVMSMTGNFTLSCAYTQK